MAKRPARILRLAAACLVTGVLILPSAAPVGAAAPEDKILRVGTMQDLDSMNPWNTALTTGFEVFNLNYEFLVGFGSGLEPVPGFAESWSRVDNGDGTFTWTFKIPEGKIWSDGTPATAEDARWTLQFVLDAVTAGNYVGLGYLDPDLTNAGVTKVEAPDATTLVLTNTDPSDRILQMYFPMLPKHVWEGQTLESIPTFANDVPVVGSGPYQAVEWKTGEFVRMVRNPNYQWTQGAPDEVVIQFFKTGDTMVQGLKTGDLDYAHGINSDQFESLKGQPGIVTVNGVTNGWTMLNLNSYANDIPGGGASTKALRDPAFRDALGYAIDKDLLIERVLGGYGTPGTTQVPPFAAKWHVEPDKPRTFDIELAKQKLDAAGYPLDGSGKRLDKEGKPITLRLYLPTDSPNYPKSAPFIKEWFGQLGIDVVTSIFDEATLIEKELPPEAGDGYTADWDMILWGWTGYADPNPLLQIFTTDQIGGQSDSLWSDATYDELYTAQRDAPSDEQRHDLMAQLQNRFYDQAPYHVLYYEDTLVAYRTDKFGGWQNQPANGVPLFGYGPLDYTLLTPAVTATPAPTADNAAPTGASPAPSAAPDDDTSGGSNTLPVIAAVAVVGLLIGGFVGWRRRGRDVHEDEED
jgi:peptide/nickel transport system substrate-binding protein